LKSTIHWE